MIKWILLELICENLLRKLNLIWNSMRARIAEEPVVCLWKDCNYVFQSNRLCLNHIKKEHDLKSFHGQCFWGKCRFRSDHYIGNHLKIHFNIVDAMCDICKVPKSFKWRSDLTRHVQKLHQHAYYDVTHVEIEGKSNFYCRRI